MVTEGENWRCKVYTKHIQDATSLAFMSKREIYEKLINNRSEGSKIEDSICISKRGRHDTKREIWNEYEKTTSFLFGT